jgi:menaquinone-9 beta-reductase
VVIGADGRKSVLAFGLGLARHPARPRRWAVGAYMSGVRPETTANCLGSDPRQFGEMHIRKNCYIGVAPVPGGLTNVCVVRETFGPDAQFRDPAAVITNCLGSDPRLRDRFAAATLAAPPVVLGPLAVDANGGSIDGLILAGDAAGFIDPMTGDGLHFAIRGGELAADAALRILANGWDGAHTALATSRAAAFARKWRFNRVLRAIVASPRALEAAALGARVLPSILRAVIAHAGDCHIAAGARSGVRSGVRSRVRSGVGSGVRPGVRSER